MKRSLVLLITATLALALQAQSANTKSHKHPVKKKRTIAAAKVHKLEHKEAAAPVHGTATQELMPLATGIAEFESRNFAGATQSLAHTRGAFPKLADYSSYYLAASEDALRQPQAVVSTLGDLADFRDLNSPLLAKALMLAARNRIFLEIKSNDVLKPAIQKLHDEIADAPNAISQPEGDYALALAYDSLGDGTDAAAYYQRVYFLYPATTMAADSAGALERLKETLAASYPVPRPQMMLERGDAWVKAREYGKAHEEFAKLFVTLSGEPRDQARVRIGGAQYESGDYRGAYAYLKSMELPREEADAERLFYIEECGRRMENDEIVMDAIKDLARHHERSVWRLKALVDAGNRYLMAHEPEKYEPLYRAAWETFPTDSTTAYCHWKITWDAYMANKRDVHELLKEQVEHYPGDNKAATALYFLGRKSEYDSDFPSARAYYERVAREFPNFYYAVLARGRLDDSKVSGAAAAEKTNAWLDSVEFPAHADYSNENMTAPTRVRVERAQLLVAAGRADLADSEVRFGARTDGQAHLLAVKLAATDAAPYLSLRHMKTLAPDYLSTSVEKAPKLFWQMLFPMPYQSSLISSARRFGLDPYMVAALIRQESEFNPGAHSYANAYGLTQIVPATGRMLARQQGIAWSSPALLYQPATNLRLGTFYMRALLNQWDGHWEETLASYNAGASRVKQWLSWGTYREPAEFVESIPITQTREYVQSVIRNAAVYRQIYGPNPPDTGTDEELPVVPVPAVAKAAAHHPKSHIVAKATTKRKPPA
jgi:soluble lytic murein transglycosylase